MEHSNLEKVVSRRLILTSLRLPEKPMDGVFPLDWNIHGVMTTVTMFFGITRAILISETKDSEITTARDLTVYLLARKCVLSYEDIARVLSFRSPARCEIAMRRIKEQMKKWGREDLWEESPFESLFKSEAEIAAPMD